MRWLANRIVHARKFEYLLVVLIIGSAALLGVATSAQLADRYWDWMLSFWVLTMFVLVLEVLLRMIALLPRADRYFSDGWNVFDFLAISFLISSLVFDPLARGADYALLIMLVRLLRLLRSLATVQELRLILSTLIRSARSVGTIVVLLGIILYAYAYVGYSSFSEYDPVHWGSFGVSVLSLIQIVTMDGWSGIMRRAIEVEPLAWIFFVSFVIISGFIIANLFVAVIIKNLGDAIQQRWRPKSVEAPASREEGLRELRAARQALDRLEERLQQLPDSS